MEQSIFITDDFIGKESMKLKENDFVFAAIGATLGKANKIGKNLAGSYYSNNTARFRLLVDDIESDYLETVLRSLVGQEQFRRYEKQTAQAKIDDEDLKKVLIPILSPNTQTTIAQKVQRSHTLREESKQLLAKAKRAVEIFIEQDEKTAMEYLENS